MEKKTKKKNVAGDGASFVSEELRWCLLWPEIVIPSFGI
jgi:hypothetical protein